MGERRVRIGSVHELELCEVLRHNYLVRGLSWDQVLGMANSAKVETYDGGEIIVRQFEKDNDLIVVLEGEARIKSFSGETVAEVGPGSIIGEVALIDDQPRSATVTAVGRTVAARISGKAIRKQMETDLLLRAVLSENIARVLCRRLRAVNVQLDLAQPRMDERIAVNP